ncbi:MAG: 4-(cytidine 5'-diphospho)-2-C-methyl-D-erythritol kinase [Dehalococcoidia bacterium]|nr:4-(cytidine 5'-diphospho)-2-C-methyl-D-erythritol kinase [Dehalococcoidia bacterium]
MRAIAPAKINWTLEVLGPRADGYHEVRTVMQTLDLGDELEFRAADAISLTVSGPLTAAEDDLALRAARLLRDEAAPGRGAAVHLSKRVPVGCGLGGGSADAAAVLRALSRLWETGWDEERLLPLAARLGSDVAFFLYGGTALAAGRGERITPLPDAPEAWLVLLAPALGIPGKTRLMYESLQPSDFTDGSRSEALVERLRHGRPLEPSLLHNAFERAAVAVFEGQGPRRQALLEAGARAVHLAGAGPALFALTSGEAEARAIRRRLDSSLGKAFVARTLTAAEARALVG